MHSVTSILLVTKARHAAAEATAAAVSQWLEAHGVACSALPADCPSEKLVGRARTSDAILILGASLPGWTFRFSASISVRSAF